MVGADVNFPIEIAPFEGHSLIFGGGGQLSWKTFHRFVTSPLEVQP